MLFSQNDLAVARMAAGDCQSTIPFAVVSFDTAAAPQLALSHDLLRQSHRFTGKPWDETELPLQLVLAVCRSQGATFLLFAA
jgi:hypothetical protein